MTGLTPDGFQTPTFQEIRDEMALAITNALQDRGINELPDFERDELWGILTSVVSLREAEVWDALQQVYDGFQPGAAAGIQLDNICRLVGVLRRQATSSVVELTLTGTAGTTILAGAVVEDTAGERWETQETVTLDGAGSATVSAASQRQGEVLAPAGSVTTIRTQVSGWTSVTNAAAATPGAERETDPQLRLRRLRALQRGTNGTRGGILSAVEAVEAVEAATVLDNPTANFVTVDGVSLAPHSFAVVVFPPGLTTAQRDEVHQAIYDTAPAGIESRGNLTKVIQGVEISFREAAGIDVDINVEVTIAPEATQSAVEAQIVASLEDYIGGLQVGEDVRILQLTRIVGTVPEVLTAVITQRTGADPFAGADIVISPLSFATNPAITVSFA